MTPVTIYSQPDCHACALVKQYLTGRGVTYTERDIRADPDALAAMRAMGALSTPVTVIGTAVVIGYNRRKLDAAFDTMSSGGGL